MTVVCLLLNSLDVRTARRFVVCSNEKLTPRELLGDQLDDFRLGSPFLFVDGKQLDFEECLDRQLTPCGFVTIGTRPAFALTAGQFFVSLLVSFFVGKIAQALLGIGRLPAVPGDGASSTYAFEGIRLGTGDGRPIPKGYGEHRVGGVVIGAYTEDAFSDNTFNSALRLLILINDGEIEGLGTLVGDTEELNTPEVPLSSGSLDSIGLQINGQPAGSLSNVIAWYRRGRLDQSAIPGFQASVNERSVDQDLDEPSGGTFPSPAGEIAAGSVDAWPHAVVYSSTENADAFDVRLQFPEGQFDISSSGVGNPNPVTVQIRYRELVAGVPTGNYIVLPAHTISVYALSAFYWSLHHETSGPGYLAPNVGNCLTLDGTNDYAEKASPSVPNQVADVVRMGVLARIRIDVNQDSNWIATHFGSNRGFKFRITSESAGAINLSHLEVTLGNGTAGKIYLSSAFYAAKVLDADSMVAFTYKANPIGFQNLTGVGELHMFVGSEIVGSFDVPAAERALWATSAASILIGRDGSQYFDGRIDELGILQSEMQDAQVAQVANAKDAFGNATGYLDAQDPSFLSIYHFDGDALDAKGANNLTLNGGATVSASGFIHKPATIVPKRAIWRIEVIRVDPENSGTNERDAVRWESVRLILNQSYRYPGYALLSVRIGADEQVNGGIPNVTTLAKLSKVWVWDGVSALTPNFIWQWTANPAWCAVDAVTNRETGLGAEYELGDIVLEPHKALEEHCDERVHDGTTNQTASAMSYAALVATITLPSPLPETWQIGSELAIVGTSTDWDTAPLGYLTITALTTSGISTVVTATWPAGQAAPVAADPSPATIEGREVRCRFDGIFDRANEDAWDAVRQIYAAGRSVPMRIDRRMSVFTNRAGEAVGILAMANIAPGSFQISYTGPRGRPNSLQLEFNDRSQNYERRPLTRNHPSIANPTTFDSFRTEERLRVGVTRRSQIERDADLELESYALSRRVVSVSASVDATAFLPGDVVKVSHDVTQWGTSGRVQQSSTSRTQIVLDRDVTLVSGTYEITLRNNATDQLQTVAVDASMVPGTVLSGATITMAGAGFDWNPGEGEVYTLGQQGLAGRLYRVIAITDHPSTLTRDLTLLEYDAAIYETDDAYGATQQEAIFASTKEGSDPGSIAGVVQGVQIVEASAQDAGGGVQPALSVSWTHNPKTRRRVGGTAIWLAEIGESAPRSVGEVRGHGNSARVIGAALQRGSTYDVWVQPIARDGRRPGLDACARVRLTFEGLAFAPAEPSGVTAAMRGERAIFAWAVPNDPAIAWIEARAGGWVLGQPIFREPARRGQSLPTEAWFAGVTNSVGKTAPRIFFASVLANGMTSAPQELAFAGSLTGAGSTIAAEALEDAWSSGGAVLTNLTTDSTYAPPSLKWSGGDLTATYESKVFDAGSAQRLVVEAFLEADQRHPDTASTLLEPPDSLEGQRWSGEGPRWLKASELQCTAALEWRYSTGASPSGAWQRFEPGQVYLRSCQFRIALTRPAATFDVRVNRLGVRLTVPPNFPGSGSGSPPEGFKKHFALGGM